MRVILRLYHAHHFARSVSIGVYTLGYDNPGLMSTKYQHTFNTHIVSHICVLRILNAC